MIWLEFAAGVFAAWVFAETVGQDPMLTWQAWSLGVIICSVGAAWGTRAIIERIYARLRASGRAPKR
jgi:hypothetical protein